ncbi:hypothetical protein V2G26_009521 [Clonostachys chloroleuca]
MGESGSVSTIVARRKLENAPEIQHMASGVHPVAGWSLDLDSASLLGGQPWLYSLSWHLARGILNRIAFRAPLARFKEGC